MKKPHLAIVRDDQLPARLIQPAPGFEKKELATWHLELARVCGFSCTYCSSPTTTVARVNLTRFMALGVAQVGAPLKPSTSPEITIVFDDAAYLAKLEAELRRLGRGFGAGETLVLSMLTDAFAPLHVRSGLVRRVVELLLRWTSFRIRILTKSGVVGSGDWLDLFATYPDRFVVGLSIGTDDDAWAERVEQGTAPPSVRLAALRRLQDAGADTFGMACPVFPNMLDGDHLERLLDRMQPLRTSRFWFEPYNARANARAVRDGYLAGNPWRKWFEEVFALEGQKRCRTDLWSAYALELYVRVVEKARREGWADRLRYLLYEHQITAADAHVFSTYGLQGVLLQGEQDEEGFSKHPVFAATQRVIRGVPPPTPGPLFDRGRSA
jgi:DNA repair photolyase